MSGSLGGCPLCADAYNLLADEAKTPEEARDLYIRGVEAGQLALGPEGFEEFDGHFWGFLRRSLDLPRQRAGTARQTMTLRWWASSNLGRHCASPDPG